MFWLGAVVSLCYVPGVTGAYIATQWPVLAILLSFGLLRSGPFTVFHAAGLAFIAYAAIRLPFSPAPYASVFGLWLIVVMGLSVWFGTVATKMRGLYAGLALGASVSSLLAVLQYFDWNTVPTMTPYPAGLYINSVQQGAVLALIVVALASERMWWWAIPLAPGIFLSHSRGAWVMLAVGLLGCCVRRLWAIGAIAAVGAFYLLSPALSSSSSDIQRMFIWRVAWDHLTWLGWGPGVFYTLAHSTMALFRSTRSTPTMTLCSSHLNTGLVPWSPLGIVGYALWRTDVKEWPIVLAFVTAGCYSMPLFIPITSFLALVAVGRVLRVHGLARSHGDNRRQHVISGEWNYYVQASRQTVPVASCNPAKG